MKTRKRWAMLLSLVMAFSMLPAQAVAADVETEQTLTVLDKGDLPEYESYDTQTVSSEKGGQAGNLTWELNDGVLVISGNGEMTETPWKDRNDIKSVQIQNGVTSIADNAFYCCTSLTSVTIPDSVTKIGVGAFDNCHSLTSITIPNSVTEIGRSAFVYCNSLTSVTIPNSVTVIGDGAFHGTSWLEAQGDFPVVNGILLEYQGSDATVIVPDSVTVIGDGAFTWCDSLTSVTIPNSVTAIGYEAFYGCDSLTSVTIPNSVTEIGSAAFYRCYSLASVTIPNSVTEIGRVAFAHCTSLTSVTIPNSVTTIGDSVFYYCTSLTSVIIQNGVTTIGDSAFYGCDSLTSVTIPNSVTEIDGYTFGCTPWLEAQGDFPVINGILLRYQGSDTTVTVPDNVSYIAYCAFERCGALTSVTIPSSVKRIGGAAFAFCYGLTEIYFAGDAPEMSADYWGSFVHATATAYYPKGAAGWAEAIKKDYTGGDVGLTWVEYDPSDPKPVDPTTPVSNIFTDITPNAWYTKAVQYVYDKGIMKGMGDATFAPSASMTRAMVAQIMYAQAGSPKVSGDMPFTDVPAGKWYYDAILWANQNGVVAGMGDGTFAPNSNITRQEYAAILYRYEKSPAVSGSLNFPDADTVSSWAKDAVLWANQNGIISGTANNGVTLLDPKGTATRAQSAVILMGYLEK